MNGHSLGVDFIDAVWPKNRFMQVSMAAMLWLFIVSMGYFGWVQPRWAEHEHARAAFKAQQRQFEKKHQQALQLDAVIRENEAFKTQLHALMNPFPSVKAEASLLEWLSKTGEKSHVHVKSLIPHKAIAHAFYSEQTIEVHVRGDYLKMQHFIGLLAQSDAPMVWGDFKLQRDEDGVLDLEGRLTVYCRLEEKGST